MKILFRKQSQGFTLVEILASLAILLIGLVGVMTLFPQGIKSARITQELTIATLLAQQKAEDLKRQQDLYTTTTTYGPFSFPVEPGYQWKASILKRSGTSLRDVTVTIIWNDRTYDLSYKM